MLKASVNLPQLLWLYVLLLHAPLGFHTEANFRLLTASNYLVTKLRNKDNKSALIIVEEYGALARYSEFMKTFHNTDITVQTTGGDAS